MPAPPARSAAWDVLRFFRDVTASLADDLTVFGGLIHAPDGSGMKLVALVVCHCGPLGAGETAAQPIKKFGSPAMDVNAGEPNRSEEHTAELQARPHLVCRLLL